MDIPPLKPLLAVAILKAIVDVYEATGRGPTQQEMLAKDADGSKTGPVNDWWFGKGDYVGWPYPNQITPAKYYPAGFAGGWLMVDIMRLLADAGYLEPRGKRGSGHRAPYIPTQSGIDFVHSLSYDWTTWAIEEPVIS